MAGADEDLGSEFGQMWLIIIFIPTQQSNWLEID
jgi:hypothetical protein